MFEAARVPYESVFPLCLSLPVGERVRKDALLAGSGQTPLELGIRSGTGYTVEALAVSEGYLLREVRGN